MHKNDEHECDWSGYEIEKFYNEVAKELFGEEKAKEAYDIVQKRKQKKAIEHDIDWEEYFLSIEEKEIKKARKQIAALRNFEASLEGKIIREVCEGNATHLKDLVDAISTNNRFGIVNNMNWTEELAKAKGELMYGVLRDNHFRVFDNYKELGLLEPLHYDFGKEWDLPDDVERAKGVLNRSKREMDRHREKIRKYTMELKAI